MSEEYKSHIITLIKKYLPTMEENIKHVDKDEYLGKTLNDYPDDIGFLWNILVHEKVGSLLDYLPDLLRKMDDKENRILEIADDLEVVLDKEQKD